MKKQTQKHTTEEVNSQKELFAEELIEIISDAIEIQMCNGVLSDADIEKLMQIIGNSKGNQGHIIHTVIEDLCFELMDTLSFRIQSMVYNRSNVSYTRQIKI